MPAAKVNQEAKRIFAKLLATEDIMVRHDASAVTATFDTDKRILTLPVLNNMDDDVYDLFVGHEVGHALFTPCLSEQGMLDVLNSVCSENIMVAKVVLNIVEDARIERMMRVKYPGLGKNFIRGYRNIFSNGFFGEDIETNFPNLNILDRLNLWYKLSIYGIAQFDMNEIETDFISMIDDAKTFDDVVDICKKIIEYLKSSKENQNLFNNQEENIVKIKVKAEGSGESEDFDSSDDTSEENEENSEDEKENDNAGSNAGLSFKEKKSSPFSEDALAKYMEKLKNDQNRQYTDNYIYNAIPTPDLTKIIVPWTEIIPSVDDLINRHIEETNGNMVLYTRNGYSSVSEPFDLNTEFNEFMAETKHSVSSMVISFKRKQQAFVSRRISIGKTGRIDMGAVHRYKYDDDLFLRSTFVPKGKNHGMIMFIDWSGSMTPYIKETIEQAMNLAYFCRIAKIPFRVYAFTDHPFYGIDDPRRKTVDGKYARYWKEYNENPSNDGSYSRPDARDKYGNPYCYVSDFHLLEFLSSDMNSSQFNHGMKNLFYVSRMCQGTLNVSTNSKFNLGGTPLNEAIIASIDIVKQFQKAHNIQIMNTIFLTDGEAGGFAIRRDNSNYSYGKNKTILYYKNRPYDISDSYNATNGLFNILREETGTRNIGFFLSSNTYAARKIEMLYYYSNNKENSNIGIVRADKIRDFRKNNFVICDHDGYDVFYIMAANTAVVSLDEVFDSVAANDDKKKIINSFVKSANNRGKSRILLNNFAEIVAQDLK